MRWQEQSIARPIGLGASVRAPDPRPQGAPHGQPDQLEQGSRSPSDGGEGDRPDRRRGGTAQGCQEAAANQSGVAGTGRGGIPAMEFPRRATVNRTEGPACGRDKAEQFRRMADDAVDRPTSATCQATIAPRRSARAMQSLRLPGFRPVPARQSSPPVRRSPKPDS